MPSKATGTCTPCAIDWHGRGAGERTEADKSRHFSVVAAVEPCSLSH